MFRLTPTGSAGTGHCAFRRSGGRQSTCQINTPDIISAAFPRWRDSGRRERLFGYVAAWHFARRDQRPDPEPPMPLATALRNSRFLAPVTCLVLAVTGSMYPGLAIPTEAAVIGVIGALALAAAQGQPEPNDVHPKSDGSGSYVRDGRLHPDRRGVPVPRHGLHRTPPRGIAWPCPRAQEGGVAGGRIVRRSRSR